MDFEETESQAGTLDMSLFDRAAHLGRAFDDHSAMTLDEGLERDGRRYDA